MARESPLVSLGHVTYAEADVCSIENHLVVLRDRVQYLSEEKKSLVTPFRLKVWAVCCSIPSGHVTTYKAISTVLGTRSPRAVGQALRNNPFAPFVPCHRVVNAKGCLHGFGGHTSTEALRRKYDLLVSENVVFVNRLQVSPRGFCIFRMKRPKDE